MNIIRNDSVITLIGPALLGGIFGFLAYFGLNPQPVLPVLMLTFVAGGVVVALVIALGLRRFLEPHQSKDEAD